MRPFLPASRFVTKRVATYVAAIKELTDRSSSDFIATFSTFVTDQAVATLIACIIFEAVFGAWILAQFPALVARWIAASEAIVLAFNERVVRYGVFRAILCLALHAGWISAIEAKPSRSFIPAGARAREPFLTCHGPTATSLSQVRV